MNSKKTFILIELTLAALLALLVSFMLKEKSGKERQRVSVIVRNSEDDQWTSFKYGLRMAAEDEEVEAYVVSTAAELSAAEVEQLAAQEAQNGAEALLVQPVAGVTAEALQKRTKIPVLLVGGDRSRETELPSTGPDNRAMGRDLARALLEDYAGNLDGKTLGLVWTRGEAEAAEARRSGFEELLAEEGAKGTVAFAVSGADDLTEQPRVNIVVAFDDGSLIAAGACAAANDLHGAVLYGIGSSARAVYYLDTGAARCLIVPDGFLMGYQSLTEVAEKVRNPLRQMKGTAVQHVVMRRGTLFTKENQEMLYTMSQ